MARGDFDTIVTAARSRGIDECLANCSSGDIRRLADAARYTGQLPLAERALRALRQRSPANAPVAAYLLGRVSESRGRIHDALRWYRRYLQEAAGGAFRSEAQAGRLRLLAASGQHQAAQNVAREYLKEHPGGVGAVTARRILKSR